MITVLGRFLDALYFSASFSWAKGQIQLFELAKKAVQDSGDDLGHFSDGITGVPGGALYLRRNGRRGYHFRFENARVYIELNTVNPNQPQMLVQFKAETLYEYDEAGLVEISHAIVRYFAGESAYKIKVNRADLALDFQQAGFRLPEMADVVTRARTRSIYYDRTSAQSLTLGKRNGALQSQIYAKSEELLVSDKAWMREVWVASGVYEPEIPVWRCEMRFYRLAFKAFEVDTIEDLFQVLGDLAAYACGGGPGSWVRVCSPESRDLKDTSARGVVSWWSDVCDGLVTGLLSQGRKRKGWHARPSFHRCVEMAGAMMARAAAIERAIRAGAGHLPSWDAEFHHVGHHKDPASWARKIGEIYGETLEQKGTSWADKLNLRTAELRGVAW
jgi:hypothetical protein